MRLLEEGKEKVLSPEECTERIRLVDEYSQLVTDYSVRLGALKQQPGGRNEAQWGSAETALGKSQQAWHALEQHISQHQCLSLHWHNSAATDQIMGQAAAAALDAILVADDDRRLVDVNEACLLS